MENIILTKLKEFIKSKVKLEKRLTDEFVSGKRELIGQIDFLRELILELTNLVESINENTDATTTVCDVFDSIPCIVGRIGLKADTADGGVILLINTQESGCIDFLYYGEDRNVLAPGMKVHVSGISEKNGTWIAQKVKIID